jgi:ribosomal protein S11
MKKRFINIIPTLKSPKDFSFLKSSYPKVFLKTTFTNVMISLTDEHNKLIACHTSGSSGVVGTSRRKKAPQAVQTIIKKLYPYFVQKNINNVELVLTRRVTQATHYLIRELAYLGIKVAMFRRRRICAHNGVRRRNLPRK